MSSTLSTVDPPATSFSERLLSWILAAFLLMALSWGYVNIDDWVRDSRHDGTAARAQAVRQFEKRQSAFARSLGMQGKISTQSMWELDSQLEEARSARDAARERYRTTLDAGRADANLKRKYLAADAEATKLTAERVQRGARLAFAEQKLKQYKLANKAQKKQLVKRYESYQSTTARIIFFLRLLMTLGALGISVLVLRLVTVRAPRMQPLAQAPVIASSLMLLVLIIDYSEVSFDFATVGPLGFAFLGAILTIGAFFALQRFLRNRRPNRRLRSGECAECGYPGRDGNYCEGCGAQLRTTCGSCGAARRSGAAHCGSCGGA